MKAAAAGARLRLVACLAFIAATACLVSPVALGAAAGVAVATALLACRRSPRALLRCLALAAPAAALVCLAALFSTPGAPGTPAFAVALGPLHLAASRAGAARAGTMALRATASLFALAALGASTPPTALVGALGGLGAPRLFVQVCLFMLRYAGVLAGETARMAMAGRARCFAAARHLIDRRGLRRAGHLAGALFERAAARADRIHMAMLARGYGAGVAAGRGAGGWRLLTPDGLLLFSAVACGVALVAVDRGWAAAALRLWRAM